MRAKPALSILIGVLVLTVGASGLLLLANLEHPAVTGRGNEFQDLLGGLGFGPALDLSRCPQSFDPRLCSHCRQNLEPLPGAGCFCPQHACSIFYYPGLTGRTEGSEP
jgi:hypothetical protein